MIKLIGRLDAPITAFFVSSISINSPSVNSRRIKYFWRRTKRNRNKSGDRKLAKSFPTMRHKPWVLSRHHVKHECRRNWICRLRTRRRTCGRVCVCVCVKERWKIELTVWGKKGVCVRACVRVCVSLKDAYADITVLLLDGVPHIDWRDQQEMHTMINESSRASVLDFPFLPCSVVLFFFLFFFFSNFHFWWQLSCQWQY